LGPRWFAAGRAGYQRGNIFISRNVYESAIGFRPSANQLVKLGYEMQQGPTIRGAQHNVLTLQIVITLPTITLAGK
jgi:hypothetical protein